MGVNLGQLRGALGPESLILSSFFLSPFWSQNTFSMEALWFELRLASYLLVFSNVARLYWIWTSLWLEANTRLFSLPVTETWQGNAKPLHRSWFIFREGCFCSCLFKKLTSWNRMAPDNLKVELSWRLESSMQMQPLPAGMAHKSTNCPHQPGTHQALRAQLTESFVCECVLHSIVEPWNMD